ncbi:MAG: DUF4177 domain-containing protein [Planctomycetota bacterium]|jgi:hypothetical protein
MRSTPLLTVVLAALLVLVTLSSFVGAEPAGSNVAAPQNWEYAVVPTPELSGAAKGKIPEHARTIQNFLNSHAQKGWEFNSVHGRVMIFRRPVSAN